MGRVMIGTCAGAADVALIKAAFEAHRIPVVINAEQHASLFGGMQSALTPLNIYVDSAHAEDGAALLADLREHDHQDDAAREAAAEDDRELAEISSERSERRRRQGTALVIVVGGAMTAPLVLGNPVLTALLVTACIGALFVTLRATPKPPLPPARIRR